jgi:hypothetical protein
VNVPELLLLIVTVHVATFPLIVGEAQVSDSLPGAGLTPIVIPFVPPPNAGVPVAAGEAVKVTVNVSAFPTSFTGVNGVIAMLAST